MQTKKTYKQRKDSSLAVEISDGGLVETVFVLPYTSYKDIQRMLFP